VTDHYEALGVGRDASDDEIKAAFRRKASKTHPDRDGGDKESFQMVRLAYEVLSDEGRRERYDRTGDDGGVIDAEKIAAAQLDQLLLSILDQAQEPEYLDLIGSMRKSVQHKQRELGMVIEARLNDLTRQQANIREAVNIGDVMMGMLDEYECAADERPSTDDPQMWVQLGGLGGTGGSGRW
jgi:curved DNA-binding protein CbpA